jgi:hypothetical protein
LAETVEENDQGSFMSKKEKDKKIAIYSKAINNSSE